MVVQVNLLKLKSIGQVLLVFAVACVLCRVFARPVSFDFRSSTYSLTLIPVIWILIPSIILLIQNRKFGDYGITLRGYYNSIKEALLVSLIVLACFLLGYYIYQAVFQVNRFTNPLTSKNLIINTFYIILFVSFPEEYFFRGYLQSELNQIFGRRYYLLKTRFGLGLIFSSVLFVFAHIIIKANLFNLIEIFPQFLWGIFPSLLFGWLREKTGGIIAPTIVHGLGDVLYYTARGILRS